MTLPACASNFREGIASNNRGQVDQQDPPKVIRENGQTWRLVPGHHRPGEMNKDDRAYQQRGCRIIYEGLYDNGSRQSWYRYWDDCRESRNVSRESISQYVDRWFPGFWEKHPITPDQLSAAFSDKEVYDRLFRISYAGFAAFTERRLGVTITHPDDIRRLISRSKKVRCTDTLLGRGIWMTRNDEYGQIFDLTFNRRCESENEWLLLDENDVPWLNLYCGNFMGVKYDAFRQKFTEY